VWYLTDGLLRVDALLHYASADTSTSLADFEKIQLLSVFSRRTNLQPPYQTRRSVCLLQDGESGLFLFFSLPPPALPLKHILSPSLSVILLVSLSLTPCPDADSSVWVADAPGTRHESQRKVDTVCGGWWASWYTPTDGLFLESKNPGTKHKRTGILITMESMHSKTIVYITKLTGIQRNYDFLKYKENVVKLNGSA